MKKQLVTVTVQQVLCKNEKYVGRIQKALRKKLALVSTSSRHVQDALLPVLLPLSVAYCETSFMDMSPSVFSCLSWPPWRQKLFMLWTELAKKMLERLHSFFFFLFQHKKQWQILKKISAVRFCLNVFIFKKKYFLFYILSSTSLWSFLHLLLIFLLAGNEHSRPRRVFLNQAHHCISVPARASCSWRNPSRIFCSKLL